ncbi:hypothetical protein BO71DRAFT_478905 [Aspergillus ellipticus CBS 707.79]|uniref:Uncharacterized protein n=1 Tax=Aspergillus ellipticus CBS 707.79 TaxID=1448320 RepID=A0A319F4Q5_9EURO|nr:hypothetical protein BO71DRAFT_478905 [Aspergillus ellipticus CBS 707.79]
MSERVKIYYTYKTIEAFEKFKDQVTEIDKADTGMEVWICNLALPPTSYPPPVTQEAIQKLKALSDDIVAEVIPEE